MNECPLKGTILKGNELSEPTINFHGILYVSFQGGVYQKMRSISQKDCSQIKGFSYWGNTKHMKPNINTHRP